MNVLWKSIKWLLVLLAVYILYLLMFWILPNVINMHDSIETDEKVVALTFDDGPYPPWTEQILALLQREQVPATFYLAGKNLENNMELGRRIIREGHEVGNHLYSGEPLTLAWPSHVKQVFAHCDALLREIGATGDITVRQGRGAGGPVIGWLVWRQNRQQIMASAASSDWLRPGWTSGECPNRILPCPTQVTEDIVADILPKVLPGGIILLHDGYDNAPGAIRSGTVAAAQIIITKLKAQGYRFVTVSELLKLDRD